MRKIYTTIIALLLAFSFTLTSVTRAQGLRQVGVQLQASGFQNEIEAKKFLIRLINLDLQPDPKVRAVFVPVSDGPSERRMEVQVYLTTEKSYNCRDGIKQQGKRVAKRAGVQFLVGLIPGGYIQSDARVVAEDVAPQAYFQCYERTANATVKMYEFDRLVWTGEDKRTFKLRYKYYSNGGQPFVEMIDGGTPRELIPYMANGGIQLPLSPGNEPDNLNGYTEQILEMMVTRTATLPEHRTPGGHEIANNNH